MDRRHRLDFRRREDHRNAFKRVVCDVAGADSQSHDFAHSHEDALQGSLMPGALNRHDVADDERCGDLVDLLAAECPDDVILEASSFFSIGHYATLFKIAPQPKGVIEYVSGWRLEPYFFASASDNHASLFQAHFWPMADGLVGDSAGVVRSKDPRF